MLVEHHGALGLSFGVLTVALGILGFLEWKALRGRNLDLEIDRLAAAAAQRQARVNSDASSLISDEAESNPANMARMPEKGPPPPPGHAMPPPPPPPGHAHSSMPPPPPPPARAVPPPPPPPSSDEDESFTARLGAAASKDMARPAVAAPPISFGNVVPPPPPSSGEGESSGPGGWADLLQRVRSNDSEPPSPFRPGSGTIPTTEDVPAPPASPPSGGGDAWEALLRKTSGSLSGEVAPPAPRSGVGLPGGSPFASSNTGGSGSDPEPGRAPLGETDDSVLPDFVRKTSRTISLDLSKGGASNPFQKPPQ